MLHWLLVKTTFPPGEKKNCWNLRKTSLFQSWYFNFASGVHLLAEILYHHIMKLSCFARYKSQNDMAVAGSLEGWLTFSIDIPCMLQWKTDTLFKKINRSLPFCQSTIIRIAGSQHGFLTMSWKNIKPKHGIKKCLTLFEIHFSGIRLNFKLLTIPAE